MSENSSSRSQFLVTLLASIGGFAIFVLILVIAYLPTKPAPLTEGNYTPEQRKAILAELQGAEKTTSTSYGWVDQTTGVVRLPLDRAVELTIAEINQKR